MLEKRCNGRCKFKILNKKFLKVSFGQSLRLVSGYALAKKQRQRK
ncbi:unnamed protein product [Arabidopsis halleri]